MEMRISITSEDIQHIRSGIEEVNERIDRIFDRIENGTVYDTEQLTRKDISICGIADYGSGPVHTVLEMSVSLVETEYPIFRPKVKVSMLCEYNDSPNQECKQGAGVRGELKLYRRPLKCTCSIAKTQDNQKFVSSEAGLGLIPSGINNMSSTIEISFGLTGLNLKTITSPKVSYIPVRSNNLRILALSKSENDLVKSMFSKQDFSPLGRYVYGPKTKNVLIKGVVPAGAWTKGSRPAIPSHTHSPLWAAFLVISAVLILCDDWLRRFWSRRQ